MRTFKVSLILLVVIAFILPIEHRYDKCLRPFTFLPEGFYKQIYFYASDVIALLLLYLGLRKRDFFNRGSFFLCGIFACALISIVASPLAHDPIRYLRLWQLSTPFILFFFLANAVPEDQKEKVLRVILWTLVAAALLQTAIAIAQYFHQGSLGIRLLREPKFGSAYPYSPKIPCIDGNLWLIDHIFGNSSKEDSIYRVHGTMNHPNALGGFLALSLLASYCLILTEKKWPRRLLCLSFPFQLFALSVSFSRSALFAWILGSLLFFGFVLVKKAKLQKWRPLALMILASIALNGILLQEQYRQRGGIVNYNSVAKNSDSERIAFQKTALQLIAKHPWTGVGYKQYPKETPFTHNIYLFLAVETGLISLGLFLGFVSYLLIRGAGLPPTPMNGSLLAMFFAILFIGGCDFYPLFSQEGKLLSFLTAGLLASQLPVKLREESLSLPPRTKTSEL